MSSRKEIARKTGQKASIQQFLEFSAHCLRPASGDLRPARGVSAHEFCALLAARKRGLATRKPLGGPTITLAADPLSSLSSHSSRSLPLSLLPLATRALLLANRRRLATRCRHLATRRLHLSLLNRSPLSRPLPSKEAAPLLSLSLGWVAPPPPASRLPPSFSSISVCFSFSLSVFDFRFGFEICTSLCTGTCANDLRPASLALRPASTCSCTELIPAPCDPQALPCDPQANFPEPKNA